jgi:DUF4097 and DUF4098 domain-containing protein YvlB
MSKASELSRIAAALIGLMIALCGCSGSDDSNALRKVNGSVHVPAGRAAESAETVNGNISVDDDAAVAAVNTVNGGIRIGAHATADSLTTVNGNIVLGAGARVARTAQSVNGGVALRDGAQVTGAVSNVNGKIELTGAHVAGGIKTVNGSIAIFGPSHVEGGILVQKSGGQFIHFGNDVPRIEIGPGASVQGDLRFEHEVKLYVSDHATIGPVTGATPIPFTGDTPPAG